VGTNGDSKSGGGQKVSPSGSSNDSSGLQKISNDFHVYNAPSLPDPKLDSESSNTADDSQGDYNDSSGGEADGMKQVCTDSSSSGEEDKLSDSAVKASFPKRHKATTNGSAVGINEAFTGGTADTSLAAPPRRTALPPNIAKSGGISHNILPPNIAKSGGISHNVRPITTSAVGNGSARLCLVQRTPLPPFLGLGKRASTAPLVGPTTVGIADVRANAPAAVEQGVTTPQARLHENVQTSVGDPAVIRLSRLPSICQTGAGVSSDGKSVVSPVLISADVDTSSSNSSSQSGEIRAYYHVNEDDMLLTDDALMCPFIFRSQDAVMCGALAECIMPGMLRAHFSTRNKLISLEMVYDAMGFMQQLERASGSEGTAQIVPGSLEMALSPTANEPRVITMAESPHQIVSVNAAWTKMTKYTQMEVEGRDLSLLDGTRTDADASVRPGKPPHKFSDVAHGRCACSTNIQYGKGMREFIAYVCSYPLTK
jgi:PAS domain-containing protein